MNQFPAFLLARFFLPSFHVDPAASLWRISDITATEFILSLNIQNNHFDLVYSIGHSDR